MIIHTVLMLWGYDSGKRKGGLLVKRFSNVNNDLRDPVDASVYLMLVGIGPKAVAGSPLDSPLC